MSQLIPDGTYIIFSVASNKVVELQDGFATGNFIVATKATAIKQYQKVHPNVSSPRVFWWTKIPGLSQYYRSH